MKKWQLLSSIRVLEKGVYMSHLKAACVLGKLTQTEMGVNDYRCDAWYFSKSNTFILNSF